MGYKRLMTDYYQKQYDEKYKEFIDQILVLYLKANSEVNKCIKQLEVSDNSEKKEHGIKFANLINKSQTNQNYLLKRKIKLFSSKSEDTKKISYSLLKYVPLK